MERERSRCGIAPAAKAAGVALVALFACALPAAGSQPQAVAGNVTIVVHGQGRVTSEPAGAIDCPGDCSHTFTGSTSLTLRAAPATGWVTAQNASCGETDLCTVALNDFGYTIDVYFRPRTKLQVWPNGDGAVTLSPTPADWLGEPDATPCTPDTAFAGTGCEYYYLPGTAVTATASAAVESTFLGWSTLGCPGDGHVRRHAQPRLELPRRALHAARGAGDPRRQRRRDSRQRARRDRLPADLHRAVPVPERGDADRATRSGRAVHQLEVRLRRLRDRSAPLRRHGDEPSQLGRRRARRGRHDRAADEPLGALRRHARRAGESQRRRARLRLDVRAPLRLRLARRSCARRPPRAGASRPGPAPARSRRCAGSTSGR